jgi:hypothetical protein
MCLRETEPVPIPGTASMPSALIISDLLNVNERTA